MIQINQLDLSEGDQMEYVYDFGSEVLHSVRLEKIAEPEKGVLYPASFLKTNQNIGTVNYADKILY